MPASTRFRAVSATAAMATALTLGVAGVAYASDDSGSETCVKADGGGLLDATADVLGAVGLNLDVLAGKDSIACAPARPTDDHPADGSDDRSCDDFDSQADAQKALDDDEDLAKFLDRDGDGVACEGLFDDDDASNDDDDDDKKSDKKSDDEKSKEKDAEKSGGGQVKVHPTGGVDTGGFAV